MPPPSAGSRLRHLGRMREIANVVWRHGLGAVVDQLGLDHLLPMGRRLRTGDDVPRGQELARRLRAAFEDLGPGFIKLGQLLSTRGDLVSPTVANEMQTLQDRVNPFPYEEVEAQFRRAFDASPTDLYDTFERSPLAAASIGQVHLAVTGDGRAVVVKVQRPHIERTIETDLEILEQLAGLAETRTRWGDIYPLQEIVARFGRTLRRELDYRQEGRHADRLRRLTRDDDDVDVPEVVWDLTSERVLTLERVDGITLHDDEALGEHGIDRQDVATTLVQSVLGQILREGFFHADPHPGNVVVTTGRRQEGREQGAGEGGGQGRAAAAPRIALMDFGMVGRLPAEMREQLVDLVMGLVRRDTDAVVDAVFEMGIVPDSVDRQSLHADVDTLRQRYYEMPLAEIEVTEAVNDIFRMAFRHRIRIPGSLTMVGKALITLEGTVERLDPELSIVEIAEPLGQQLLRHRLDPKRLLRRAVGDTGDWLRQLVALPGRIEALVDHLESGELSWRWDPDQFDRLSTDLDRLGRRVLLGAGVVSVSLLTAGAVVAGSLGGSWLPGWGLWLALALTGVSGAALLIGFLR